MFELLNSTVLVFSTILPTLFKKMKRSSFVAGNWLIRYNSPFSIWDISALRGYDLIVCVARTSLAPNTPTQCSEQDYWEILGTFYNVSTHSVNTNLLLLCRRFLYRIEFFRDIPTLCEDSGSQPLNCTGFSATIIISILTLALPSSAKALSYGWDVYNFIQSNHLPRQV